LKRQAKTARVYQATAATPEDVEKIIAILDAGPKVPALFKAYHQQRRMQGYIDAAFTALWWLTAARGENVLSLRAEDIVSSPAVPPTGLPGIAVTFYQHKTMGKRDPYTVHTAVHWKQYLDKLPKEGKLFPDRKCLERVTRAMRQLDPPLEARSFRRGALRTLAATGVDATTLLSFSRHASEKTLMRYLDWGRYYVAGRNAAVMAAQALIPASARKSNDENDDYSS
jgi:hypothetical protein